MARSSSLVRGGSRSSGDGDGMPPLTLASRRQERNRVAARRSREKKKEYVQELEATAHALVIKNKELIKDVRKLRKEIAELRGLPYDGGDDAPAPTKPALNRRGGPVRASAATASLMAMGSAPSPAGLRAQRT